MIKITVIILKLIAISSLLAGVAGCLSPIAMTTFEAAGSSAPVAFDHLGGGKSESYWVARYDDVVAAAGRAAETLSLEIQEKRIEKDQAFFRLADATGKKIKLSIARRTDTLTSMQYDVGWFGPIAFGRILDNQIIFELTAADAFLGGWSPRVDHLRDEKNTENRTK